MEAKIQEVKIVQFMTSNFEYVAPNTIMTDVAKIFDRVTFHHLPVLDEQLQPLGVISRLDYHQVQHHFTRFGWQNPEIHNAYLFGTLLAREVMTKPATTLDSSADLQDAIDIFMKNQVHSILITLASRCVGILTPFDVIKALNLSK